MRGSNLEPTTASVPSPAIMAFAGIDRIPAVRFPQGAWEFPVEERGALEY